MRALSLRYSVGQAWSPDDARAVSAPSPLYSLGFVGLVHRRHGTEVVMTQHCGRAVLLFCGLWAASQVRAQDQAGQNAGASALQCTSAGAAAVPLERRLRQ